MQSAGHESDRQFLEKLCSGLPVDPLPPAPPPQRDPSVPHAPVCAGAQSLAPNERRQAVRNALRYFPRHTHATLAPEFAAELRHYGHIYMYRFMPDTRRLRAYPLETIPAQCRPHAAAIILMILNNLDRRVAQYPHELVTYGTSGQTFSNWAQFLLTLHYLATMNGHQTLVLYSGHPHGVFPAPAHAPRLLITNGMVVPEWGNQQQERLFALGVSQYGQMTAGSFCYIGPQGIVHGTSLTLLGAARKRSLDGLAGRVFVTAGLGGMSGAQAKAATIVGCVGIVAEPCKHALEKRRNQGWLHEVTEDLDQLVRRIRRARVDRQPVSIGYHGNVVEVWERLVEEHRSNGELLVDLGSDQTSCHAAYSGGYWPVQLSLTEARQMLATDPEQFARLVAASLQRQTAAINYLSSHGMYFWDYGNAFLLEAARAGSDVLTDPGSEHSAIPASSIAAGEVVGVGSLPQFRYPSYVQDIMGEVFSIGFGPFRWVCTSGKSEELSLTDSIAIRELTQIIESDQSLPDNVRQQHKDNILWLEQAAQHQLVVGSQARILYTDAWGRRALALAFNRAVDRGQLSAPIIISRDHHDVSACDSPLRETADIADGSAVCADMAVHNCLGSAARGATWAALHNGGGVGWGRAVNGGLGLVLDGSEEAMKTAHELLGWDVNNGVARRAWAGNQSARETIDRAQQAEPQLKVTVGHQVDMELLKRVVTDKQ